MWLGFHHIGRGLPDFTKLPARLKWTGRNASSKNKRLVAFNREGCRETFPPNAERPLLLAHRTSIGTTNSLHTPGLLSSDAPLLQRLCLT
eukprot:3717941-Amphidinium_carterae.2